MLYLFDLDGTLIDSNGIWEQVDRSFLQKRGLPYTAEYRTAIAHTIFTKGAALTKEMFQLSESCEEIMAEWLSLAEEGYAKTVPLKAGVRDFLEDCAKRGIPMVIATASIPSHCRAVLQQHNLSFFFSDILFAQEWGLEKKDPRFFERATQHLAVSPKDCVLFDDSVAACQSAKKAGLTVVGMADPAFREDAPIMQEICDGFLSGFDALPPSFFDTIGKR